MMMTEIRVVHGVEPPKPREVFVYPHAEMDVGDSFVVHAVAYRKVLNANTRAAKRLGYKFSARREGELLRVWRVK